VHLLNILLISYLRFMVTLDVTVTLILSLFIDCFACDQSLLCF